MNPLLEIPKRGPVCHRGKEMLTPGSDYYSALLEDPEGQGFVRQDFCPSCWEARASEESSAAVRSHWKGKVPLKEEVVAFDIQSQDQQIFNMLHEALLADTPESNLHAFVLALYLARRKKLILRQELKPSDKPVYLYEIAANEEMLAVPKVKLSVADMNRIQQELTQKLKNPKLRF